MMEKFERMAAEREAQRVQKERRVELLNETSYDRRRQVRPLTETRSVQALRASSCRAHENVIYFSASPLATVSARRRQGTLPPRVLMALLQKLVLAIWSARDLSSKESQNARSLVRQVAVHKADGTRGHHMQDYIPPEELQKFMAKVRPRLRKCIPQMLCSCTAASHWTRL